MKQSESIISETVVGQGNKKEKRRKGFLSNVPLKVQLVGYFLLFAFVMLILLWFFQIVFLDDFYRLIKTEQIESSTEYVSENIENENVTELIEEIQERNNMKIALYDTTGQIFSKIYSTTSEGMMSMDFMPHEIYACYNAAKENGGSVVLDSSELTGEIFTENDFFGNFNGEKPRFDREKADDEMSCAQITETESGKEYMVVIRAEITPVTSAVETLRIQLIIVTCVLIAIAIVFAFAVSETIAKPIVRTNNGAKELARQNYQISFEGGSCKEISELNTTLNIAATELSTVDRLRQELIANISHDLRTPLTMIGGYAEAMRDIPGENNPENVQVIIDESRRLSQLVNDLLDVSKMESGAVPLNMEVFNLSECIRGLFIRYNRLQGEMDYTLEFEHSEDVYVNGDEIRIYQVLYNLINNAINYSSEDKNVTVRQTVEGKLVRIEVVDRGEGIAPDDLKYIWDRYYRVDREHKSAVVGSGLGLAIVKNVLVLHNARFGVKSGVGIGSTFWFELPVEELHHSEKTDNEI